MTTPPKRVEVSERGAALLLALLLTSVLLLVATGGAILGSWGVLRARVAAVADVAALAAAQSQGDPCGAAHEAAAANAMQVVDCAAQGSDTLITVAAEPPPSLGRLMGLLGRTAPVVTARARAGPPAG